MKVLVAESRGFSRRALSLLEHRVHVALCDLDRAALLKACSDVEVLWVRLRNQIDAEVMDAAPSLKTIVTATTGLDHVDLNEAKRRGIRVLSLSGETEFLRGVRATAEHTLALALALVRRIPAATRHVLSGGWDRDQFRGNELAGKTVGVVGYGRLGRMVAEYYSGIHMQVIATDPYRDDPMLVSPETLWAEADLVSLHVPLGPMTKHLVGPQQFAALKPGGWLVNTSRGEIVDDAALLAALESGLLAGAALDVIAHERRLDQSHGLVRYAETHDNLLITPHIGGCTVESMENTEVFLADKLCAELAVIERR